MGFGEGDDDNDVPLLVVARPVVSAADVAAPVVLRDSARLAPAEVRTSLSIADTRLLRPLLQGLGVSAGLTMECSRVRCLLELRSGFTSATIGGAAASCFIGAGVRTGMGGAFAACRGAAGAAGMDCAGATGGAVWCTGGGGARVSVSW